MKSLVNDDPLVKRLRGVMVGAVLISMFITLAGQPAVFWRNPEAAVRGDGLGIHNAVNHSVEFFLGQGWAPFALSCLVYLGVVVAVVSILPKKAALIAVLSVIFGHFYGANNWLAVGWHLGFTGVGMYAVVLGAAIAWAAAPIPAETGDQIVRRLRWVMLFDPIVTLIGEPGSYWANPRTVHEGNPFWRWFMARGRPDYLLMDLAYCLGAFLLVSILIKHVAGSPLCLNDFIGRVHTPDFTA